MHVIRAYDASGKQNTVKFNEIAFCIAFAVKLRQKVFLLVFCVSRSGATIVFSRRRKSGWPPRLDVLRRHRQLRECLMTSAKWLAATAVGLCPLVGANAADCIRYTGSDLERALVQTESSANPFAIGVVNGYLKWQPRSKNEAIATAQALKAAGYNFSMGCRQVNLFNLPKYGLDFESVFDPETNSRTGTDIFNECKGRALSKFGNSDAMTRAALSCYYSGNFTTGQRKEGDQSYVDKVLARLAPGERKPALAIPVVSTKSQGEKAGVSKPSSTAPREPSKSDDWDVFNEL
jgi:type IV secretion system protein VirB1